MESLKSKWETILILITIVGSVVLFVNPRLLSLEGGMDNLEANVDDNAVAISELGGNIDVVEAKFGNKFENLANMMIVAHTNGNVTEAELVEIWERLNNE